VSRRRTRYKTVHGSHEPQSKKRFTRRLEAQTRPAELHRQDDAMNLRTEHLVRCLQTLEKSLERVKRAPEDSIDYEIWPCRNLI